MFIGPTKLTRTDKVSYIKRGGSINFIWCDAPIKTNAQGIGLRAVNGYPKEATNTYECIIYKST